MATVTENVSPRKSKTPRALKLLEAPAPQFDGYGAIRITEGKKVDVYLIRQFEADWGEGWSFEKLGEDLTTVETYDVNLMGNESTCTCPGNTYHGHCRHVESLTALDKAGKLQRAKYTVCPRCQAYCDGGQLCDQCQAEDDYYTACDQMAAMEIAAEETFGQYDVA